MFTAVSRIDDEDKGTLTNNEGGNINRLGGVDTNDTLFDRAQPDPDEKDGVSITDAIGAVVVEGHQTGMRHHAASCGVENRCAGAVPPMLVTFGLAALGRRHLILQLMPGVLPYDGAGPDELGGREFVG